MFSIIWIYRIEKRVVVILIYIWWVENWYTVVYFFIFSLIWSIGSLVLTWEVFSLVIVILNGYLFCGNFQIILHIIILFHLHWLNSYRTNHMNSLSIISCLLPIQKDIFLLINSLCIWSLCYITWLLLQYNSLLPNILMIILFKDVLHTAWLNTIS